MNQIKKLSKEISPLSQNQLNRWIQTKEYHANNVQTAISKLFSNSKNKEGLKLYRAP